jgi:Pentapeptide repeats (8 copies)
MKSGILDHRDRRLAVISIALGVVTDTYLGRAWLTESCSWWGANYQAVAPIGNWIGGGIAAWVALSQLSIARKRHDAQVRRDNAQTEADRQRRIQESFVKAVEMLASDKMQVRLGGIYALERIYMRESQDDYWTIIETLTAFVRDIGRRKKGDLTKMAPFMSINSPELLEKPDKAATDVSAAMSVLLRRPEWGRQYENENQLQIDLANTALRQLVLTGIDLRRANFTGADLRVTWFMQANLSDSWLPFAKLNSADFRGANLRGARLFDADMEGTLLHDADLCGANLHRVENLTQEQLNAAKGNIHTILPEGILTPPHWSKD